jgi:hypothetical protein
LKRGIVVGYCWYAGIWRFSVAACNKPASILAYSGETFASGECIEDIVREKTMAKEVG